MARASRPQHSCQSVHRAPRQGAAQHTGLNRSGGCHHQILKTKAISMACQHHSGSVQLGLPIAIAQKVLPNKSLNRTHCGMRPKARHFILGL